MARGVLAGWGRILAGYHPNLSIEITRECPLRCPGCYAYGDEHLGGGVVLRQLADYKGQELIDRFLEVVRREKPVHLSIVGGEPLVRFRELDVILPKLSSTGINVQVVTSAVRPVPEHWAKIPNLQICVSIDGLAPEHDVRRAPATYDRILKHIKGQQITVHCTVTRQQTRPGYVTEFTEFWNANADTKNIWFSLYTPQKGERSPEMLTADDRRRVVGEIMELTTRVPKLGDMRKGLLESYLAPPKDPESCIFAQTTTCLSSDLEKRITPCQFGGDPDCSQCGCMASAALDAIGRYRLPAVRVRAGQLFWMSLKVGGGVRKIRSGEAAAQ
ncbi:MAG TPA: radical SAM protein [Vicinamibacterales bacterium]|nr:radical SAM protein [Vicinamibacterales bacterium]